MQHTEKQQYRGVHCLFCGEPIPVPPRMVNRGLAAGNQGSNSAYDMSRSPFNLRCRACMKEHFYQISETVDIAGTPRSLMARAASPA